MAAPPRVIARADEYCRRRPSVRVGSLGDGKDGAVWQIQRRTGLRVTSALKIHDVAPSYQQGRNAYLRFRDAKLTSVAGFNVPALVDFDDELLAIEMRIVTPPFVLDFASVVLDVDPELIEDEGHTLKDLVRERFGADRVATVLDVRDERIARAGAYLSDLHGHNIKFG